ncbi:MAG: FAD-dependent oxidoreductase, partial [Planctomycetes bacterium]|nr:FAD-dependent oxidoreductase [Planctomycetota bacterium]
QRQTTFDRQDFTRLLIDQFGVAQETVDRFFEAVRRMDFYDDDRETTREMFKRFFPGRSDVVRLLMEPITYANGSTLDDPAITYGIVFSNFMSKGVYIFRGGTDKLIHLMKAELKSNGVDLRQQVQVDRIMVDSRRVAGVVANGKRIHSRTVVSNANLKTTIAKLVGFEHFSDGFTQEAKAVRLNNSSCQVYIALKPGEGFDFCGDLLFHSEHTGFDIDALLSRDISSRTFSFYYPKTRPENDRYLIVSSTNAHYHDWAGLPEEEYRASKADLCETTLDCLEKYIPNVREKADHVEASTPRTFERYTQHMQGASFGTKFEGLKISKELPEQISGLFHAGSVGIIMSGWLGALNYGVIVANNVDKLLTPAPARV